MIMNSYLGLRDKGHFPFVRTDWPDHNHNENFTFNQDYPARSVKS